MDDWLDKVKEGDVQRLVVEVERLRDANKDIATRAGMYGDDRDTARRLLREMLPHLRPEFRAAVEKHLGDET